MIERTDLADELKRLARNDLHVRQRLLAADELSPGYHPEMRAVHRRNGDRLERDADPRRLANLEDRIRYFEGRQQRYGTHVGWNEQGMFGPWPPVEEPDLVDERRATLGLPPLAAAMAAARADQLRHRPSREILQDHESVEDFARQAGWRGEGVEPRGEVVDHEGQTPGPR